MVMNMDAPDTTPTRDRLKEFIYELDVPVIVGGCATHQAALHLMRTGAAGVLVGFGGGAAHTTRTVLGVAVPMASAVADVAAARRDYLDESGGRYVHVIADGSIGMSGDIAKAIACGADAVMVGSPFARATDAPGHGFHWGAEAHHRSLPRGERVEFETVGTLEEILFGPSRVADGTMNLSAPSSARWPPPATPSSRSSSASRSWSSTKSVVTPVFVEMRKVVVPARSGGPLPHLDGRLHARAGAGPAARPAPRRTPSPGRRPPREAVRRGSAPSRAATGSTRWGRTPPG